MADSCIPTASEASGPSLCYFMVVDILGFSEIIKNLNGDEQNQRIADWVDLVETAKREAGVKETQLISDTLFVREEDSVEGLERLLRFGKILLERGLEINYPLRGAIVHGSATWGNPTYGKAVIAAHEVERALDWIGIACDLHLPHLGQLWGWDKVVRYPVPRKSGAVEMMGAVTWEVPRLAKLGVMTTDKGLVDPDERANWGVITKQERTHQFGIYLTLGQSAGMYPASEPGWSPMDIIAQILGTI